MRTNYYLLGSVAGLIFVPVVATVIMEYSVLVFFSNGFWLPILAGYIAVLFAGRLADKRLANSPRNLILTLLVLKAVFLAGVIVGCLGNIALVFSRYYSEGASTFAWADYFVKPFLALVMVGIPCSIVLGILYFSSYHFFSKRAAHENSRS